MTNSLSEDIYALGELMATNLVTQGVTSADADDGLTTLANKILDITGSGTQLSINVPLNLIYSDDFNITGTLLDGNDSAIAGATIKLKVGNTVVDTETTDSNGDVSFTHSPVSMGTHSFQLVFEGDSTHPPAISSVVTREIGKETSVITVTTPYASSTYYSDATINVTGSLKTDDNEAIGSATVLVKLGATTLTSLTTDSNGAFSGSVNASSLALGSNTLKFLFETTSYYATSYQDVGVSVNSPSLSLTGDKSIISAADSEFCTLTATYVGANVSGKTVSFEIRKSSDDTLVDTLVDDTDSSGVANVSYSGEGAGDLYIQASCSSILSQTYDIEDCSFYDNQSTNKTSDYTKVAGVGSISNTSFSQNEYISWTCSDFVLRKFATVNTGNAYSISADIMVGGSGRKFNGIGLVKTSDTTKDIVWGYYNSQWYAHDYGSSSAIYNYSYSMSKNTWYHIELQVKNNNLILKVYANNGTLITENTSTLPSAYQGTDAYVVLMNMEGNVTAYAKNLKIKPL